MTHSYVWHDSFVCVTWLIRMCDVTHSYVRHDSFVCVTWLIRMCDMNDFYTRHKREGTVIRLAAQQNRDPFSYMACHDSFVRVTLLMHPLVRLQFVALCAVTDSHMRHDSFLSLTWLIPVWHDSFLYDTSALGRFVAVIRFYVCLDWFACETWLIPMHDMAYSYTWHECIGQLSGCHPLLCVTWHVWRDCFARATWLIPVCNMPHFDIWHEPFGSVAAVIP